MAELAVARTYGSALFEAARDLDKIELIKNEIAEMLEIDISEVENIIKELAK